jgi:putative hemolysin
MEILIILLLTILNGFFSLSEIALVSVKKSRIEHLVAQNNEKAKIILKLINNPEHFLSSVQVGITLIGIISGAYGGAALTDDLEQLLLSFNLFSENVHTISLIVVIGLITYITIVLGELVPKTLAMTNPEKIALTCVPIINYFTYAVYPFVKLLSFSTNLIMKFLGVKEIDNDHMSEEELIFALHNAGKSGVLAQEESQIHQNIFYFNDQTAKSLMTHSSEVEWVDISNNIEDIYNQLIKSTHSKFLACENSIDKCIGTFTLKDFFEKYKQPDFKLDDILDDPLFIVQNTPSFQILKEFKIQKQYIGIVLDEYGETMGIITLHDLIEAIVGVLPEENIAEDDAIFKVNENEFILDGKTTIFELNQYFNNEIIEDSIENYTTIAGFVFYQLKRLPLVGDYIDYENNRYVVCEIKGTKIEKIQLLVNFNEINE